MHLEKKLKTLEVVLRENTWVLGFNRMTDYKI